MARDLVLTAAHCVAPRAGAVREIAVIPGIIDGSTRPYGEFFSSEFFVHPSWDAANPEPSADMGAIVLSDGIHTHPFDDFMYYRTRSYPLDDTALPPVVKMFSYPGDKPTGTVWYASGAPQRRAGKRLYYMQDTFGGQSGSALFDHYQWYVPPSERDKGYAFGIHGYGGCPNSGLIFSGYEEFLIERWMQLA